MQYLHKFTDGSTYHFPLGKVVCVGRNYAEHAKELNNPVPSTPILFIKPATSVVPLTDPLVIPEGQGACHFETELAILIGASLRHATHEQVRDAIAGVGLAFDLTLRDLQSTLKEKSLPWEIAKSFDGACPLSAFVKAAELNLENPLHFSMKVDGKLQQQGSTDDMITPIIPLIAYMSQHFTLQAGDVVLTGTPAGVGPLASGMTLAVELTGLYSAETNVR
ncbi:MAG: fumarylacetoacetate hydrolase family protein [Hahellaceae bacterium]|nr:fumarylacetoacetate hydrolase family protein [Hahellaceae bacterium]MCP5170056.1 fumarylacetoacetate hydrolase family protein [Hahellaceae bacterium]